MFPLLCVAAILVSIINGNTVDDEKNNILFDQHLKQVQRFPCSVPKERSFSVNDLFKTEIGTDEILIPSYTTLHRCDANSGCCLSIDEVCTAVRQEKINVVFRIVSAEKVFRTFKALNHTQCMCVKMRNSQPKRLVQTLRKTEEVELMSENTLNISTPGSGSVSKLFLTYTLHLSTFVCILILRSILPA